MRNNLKKHKDVCAIIVAYNPNKSHLSGLCQNLVEQGVYVIIVDNTPSPYIEDLSLYENCSIVELGGNKGIAYAQNVGIQEAVSKEFSIFIFLDQDSGIKEGFVRKLLDPLTPASLRVVAPISIDDQTYKALPALRIDKIGRPYKVYPPLEGPPFRVGVVISSGTATTRKVFDIVGRYNEGLFIDHVDTEWCLRCRKYNIPIDVLPGVVMNHRIGSKIIHFLGRSLQLHSADRCYYQIRNSILLMKNKDVPRLFALNEIVATIFNKTILFIALGLPLKYLRACAQGIWDGLRGRVYERVFSC